MTNNSVNICRYSYSAAGIGIFAAAVTLCAMVRGGGCGGGRLKGWEVAPVLARHVVPAPALPSLALPALAS